MAYGAMAGSRPVRLKLDGVLILDKPSGISSNQALQRAKFLLRAARCGHTGSLDPLATGVLPLCFGNATRFARFLLEADKEYYASFRFGVSTTTGDAQGEVLTTGKATGLKLRDIEERLGEFQGPIWQLPPMYSALKHQGQPLYRLARKGIEVPRSRRQVTIHAMRLLRFAPGPAAEADFHVHCSKGTYIRSLAQALGDKIGCGAHVVRLRRGRSGPFRLAQAVSLEALSSDSGDGLPGAGRLLPVDCMVATLKRVKLDMDQARQLCQGQSLCLAQERLPGMVALYLRNGRFIGVGEVGPQAGRLAPRRLLPQDTGEAAG